MLACVGHNSSNITDLCCQKFWLASATTPVIPLACLRKNTVLHRSHHYPVSLEILACVSHNFSYITGLCQKKYWPASATSLSCVIKYTGLNTGLRQLQHLSASAISLADISHTTTPANIPRFPGSRESDRLSTVCRFWEWKQLAHCSAPMCNFD